MLVVGKVYRFDYLQGTQDGFRIGRVLKVRDTYANPITYAAKRTNPGLLRSRYLLTVREFNGQCKTMYSHAMHNVQTLGIVKRIGLWLAGVKV